MTIDFGYVGFAAVFAFAGGVPSLAVAIEHGRSGDLRRAIGWSVFVAASLYIAAHCLVAAFHAPAL